MIDHNVVAKRLLCVLAARMMALAVQ